MNKSVIIIFLVSAMLKTQAQDYLISFAGSGGSTTVYSVQVRNLTQNTSLSLDGTDILHLMGVVGIDQANEPGSADLRIYHNPAIENSFIEFEAACSGMATIDVFDITGKQVTQTQQMLPCGRHLFAVSGLRSGIYPLCIKSAGYVYSGKIVFKNTGPGNPKLSYVSGDLQSTAHGSLKSIQSLVPMQYNDGDQLLYNGISGIYSTIFPDVPAGSKTVTFDFEACTDADNNNYSIVQIGTQTWMAENLNVGVRIDAVQDQTDNGTLEKYCYNNIEANCAIYGGLYQWKEMMQYVNTPGVQGICPTGWHVPTVYEWTTLTTYLGGESVAGGKMKSTGTIEAGTGLWLSPNTGATNESGFTAVPAGYRWEYGTFYSIGESGYWWSSSGAPSSKAFSWYLSCGLSNVGYAGLIQIHGFSVRCLRD